MNNIHDKFRGCLLGLATGDAVGTAVEFEPRGSFPPVIGMTGGGPFDLKPGEWTDDTSLALCLATSLVETGGFDPHDQLERYCRWYETGYMSSNGRCFDIGSTTYRALTRFRKTGEPFSGATEAYSAGNGSIMRLAPVVLFFYPDREKIWFYCGESSRTTHGATECLEACQLLGDILYRLLSGSDKETALFDTLPHELTTPALQSLARGEYRTLDEHRIQGSGYVVKSLEAALWSFWMTDDFESAILKAVNLGDDADTTAAVCGQLAGAYYGETGIPSGWLGKLAMRAEISHLSDRLTAPERPAQ